MFKYLLPPFPDCIALLPPPREFPVPNCLAGACDPMFVFRPKPPPKVGVGSDPRLLSQSFEFGLKNRRPLSSCLFSFSLLPPLALIESKIPANSSSKSKFALPAPLSHAPALLFRFRKSALGRPPGRPPARFRALTGFVGAAGGPLRSTRPSARLPAPLLEVLPPNGPLPVGAGRAAAGCGSLLVPN